MKEKIFKILDNIVHNEYGASELVFLLLVPLLAALGAVTFRFAADYLYLALLGVAIFGGITVLLILFRRILYWIKK